MKQRLPLPLDILVFDMDGVLIDVSESYRKTISKTVQIYLETCLGFNKRSASLITGQHISSFKMAGGFNNDWDLTSALLLFLASKSGLPPLPRQKSFGSIEDVTAYLRSRSSGFRATVTMQIVQNRLPSFIREVIFCGGGMKGVHRALRKNQKTSWAGWVYHSGDIRSTNVVKRIFQEIYLGRTFVTHYSLRPLFYHSQGYHLRERLLIPRQILSSLHKRVRMGIASGRPRREAELALKRFRINRYFDRIVTLDECAAEEARLFRMTGRKPKRTKPHPYPLLRVIREMGLPRARSAYVGDVVDDIQAARAASRKLPVVPIGFVGKQPEERSLLEALRKAGAHFIIQQPEDLLRLVS